MSEKHLTPFILNFCIFECISLMYSVINHKWLICQIYIYTPWDKLTAIFTRQKDNILNVLWSVYLVEVQEHYGKHSGHGSVHLWHHSGTSLFLVLLRSSETNKPVNKLCLTTPKGWNFLIKREVLVISVANLVASFPPKIVWGFCQMQCLPPSSLGCIQWSVVSYQQVF